MIKSDSFKVNESNLVCEGERRGKEVATLFAVIKHLNKAKIGRVHYILALCRGKRFKKCNLMNNGTGVSVPVRALVPILVFTLALFVVNFELAFPMHEANSLSSTTDQIITGTGRETHDANHGLNRFSWRWEAPLPQGADLCAVDVADPDTVFAVGKGGTVIKSEDGGTSWQVQRTGVTQQLNDVEAVDPWTAWAVGDDGLILKTEDGGKSWINKAPSQGSPTCSPCFAAVEAYDRYTVWVAPGMNPCALTNPTQLMRSTDGGNNWTGFNISFNDPYVYATVMIDDIGIVDEDSIWVVGKYCYRETWWKKEYKEHSIIARTDDGGKTWVRQNPVFGVELYSISVVNSRVAWAVGREGLLFRTTDGGTSWQYKQTGGYDWVAIEAFSETLAYILTWNGTVYRTTDGGVTWIQIQALRSGNGDIAAFDESRFCVVGECGALYRLSNQGQTVEMLNTNVFSVTDISAVDATTAWACGNDVVLRTTDGGDTWMPIKREQRLENPMISVPDKSRAWILGSNELLLRTTDGGSTWSEKELNNVVGECTFFGALDEMTAWVAYDSGILLKTSDGGETWETQHLTGDYYVEELTAIDENRAWLVAMIEPWEFKSSIFATEDGGKTWVEVWHSEEVRLWEIEALDPSHIWAAGDGVFFFDGFSWQKLCGVGMIKLLCPVDESILWGTTSDAVIISYDGGRTWEVKNVENLGIETGYPLSALDENNVWLVANGGIAHTTNGGKNPPYIHRLSSSYGEVGTTLTVEGSYFGEGGEGYAVRIADHLVTDLQAWEDGRITFTVPQIDSGRRKITVLTPLGESNPAYFYVAERRIYFAEGHVGDGFQEYLCFVNPVGETSWVKVLLLLPGGSWREYDMAIPAEQRATFYVNGFFREVSDVAAEILVDGPIIAERSIYFRYGGGWDGGHVSHGISKTSKEWYFAEGYTGEGFEEWLSVLNPGEGEAHLTFHFHTQEEGYKPLSGFSVPGFSRGTFKVNDLLGGRKYQVSVKVESDLPVVVERPIYFSYLGTGNWGWHGGHCVLGATELHNRYYFAEGSTRQGFEEWLVLQNPNQEAIEVEVSYYAAEGQDEETKRNYTVPSLSRATVYVPDEVGGGKDVSISLSSEHDFLAERSMYFRYTLAGDWTGGDCVMGIPQASAGLYFAEGYTGSRFHEYLCLFNPGDEEATMRLSYYTWEKGKLEGPEIKVPPKRRVTLLVNEYAGWNLQLSGILEVTTGPEIIGERCMYFDYLGISGGHTQAGQPLGGLLD